MNGSGERPHGSAEARGRRRSCNRGFQVGPCGRSTFGAEMTGSKRLMLALSGALIACACAIWRRAAPRARASSRSSTRPRTSSRTSKAHAGVLTTRISHESAQLDRLTAAGGRPAEPRGRGRRASCAQKQAELEQAQARLDHLKQRLGQAVQILEQRLVAIYESNEPDLITVLLQSHGFDDLLARTQYLRDASAPGQRHRRQGARAPQRDAGHRQHGPGGPRPDRGAQAGARRHPGAAQAADRQSSPRRAASSTRR